MYGSRAADQYSTTVMGDDINEDRNGRWTKSRKQFDPTVGVLGRADYRKLLNHYHVVGGRKYSFRFEDPTDCSAELALIDTSAGGTEFQMRQEYRVEVFAWDGSFQGYESTYRDITLVDPSSAWISLNGVSLPVTQNPNTNYLFNEPSWNENGNGITASVSEDGIVTLSDAITSSDELRATFVFHYRVRFLSDALDRTYTGYESFTVQAGLIEVGVEEEA